MRLDINAVPFAGLSQVFSFDWLAIQELDDYRHVSPRIAAYSGQFLRDLMKEETYETGDGKIYGKTRVRNSPFCCTPEDRMQPCQKKVYISL
jgi:hypothetical protein